MQYLYDLGGQVIGEKNSSGVWLRGYVYLGGSLLAQYANSSTYFVHKDHLGSTRLLTAMDQSAYDSLDYLPFGEQIAGDTGSPHKFTGKERDSESGLDYFGARYMGSSLGRFMSADPDNAGADAAIPQSWNAYAYVGNNPLNAVDPDGEEYYLLGREQCGKTAQCDEGGYVLDDKGNRVIITDPGNLPEGVTAKLDKEGNLQFATAQGTFQGEFFDPSPFSVTVTPSFEDQKFMMLLSLGENLSSPGQWADVSRHGMEGAMALQGIAALPSTIRGGVNLLNLLRTAGAAGGGLTPGTVFNAGKGLLQGEAVLSLHAAKQAAERGVTAAEIAEALSHVPKQSAGVGSVVKFIGKAAEVRVNRVTGTIVTVFRSVGRGAPSPLP